MKVTAIRHPYYSAKELEWEKWRRTYEGGQQFIDRYLETFSKREGAEAYAKRKKITYNPAFAKEAVNEIKNSIFQRMTDITRRGGSDSFHNALRGIDGGVDLLGSTMNSYIGRLILPELLVMSKVGVFVDMPSVSGVTMAETKGIRPYIYTYKAEDICSWAYDDGANQNEFCNILLRDYYFKYDDDTGLPIGECSRYRRLWLADGRVHCQFTDEDGTESDIIILNIPRIPFLVVEISDSLLTEVANYQIALLNLASSDMAYALNSNFPFYTEQYDPRSTVDDFMRKPEGTKGEEVKVGTTIGRKYSVGTDRPGFINPSSEPLEASMKKQEQLKYEIRQLVNLTVANLNPKSASAESKKQDQSGLESGLSYIGLELEYMENKVASYWAMYEGSQPANVFYPETYSIKSDEERQAEAKRLTELLPTVSSHTYRKAIARRIAELTVGRRITHAELQTMYAEIDKVNGLSSNGEQIAKDVEVGLLDLETASKLRGYPAGTVKKAAEDHADRLARIAASQQSKNEMVNGAARGVPDLDDNPTSGSREEKKESRETVEDDTVKEKVRGSEK